MNNILKEYIKLILLNEQKHSKRPYMKVEELENYENINSFNKIPKYYIHFSKVDKLSFNPKYYPFPIATPFGIYGYPINRDLIDKLSAFELEDLERVYGYDRPYIFIFEIDDNLNLFTFEQKYMADDFDKLSDHEKRQFSDDLGYIDYEKMIQYVMSKGGFKTKIGLFNILNKKMGFDGVYDGGYSIISTDIKSQIVLFNKKFKIVDTFRGGKYGHYGK